MKALEQVFLDFPSMRAAYKKHKRLDVEICRRLCVDGNDNNNDKTDRFDPGISLYPFSLTCHCSLEVCQKHASNTPTNMSCTFTSKFSS